MDKQEPDDGYAVKYTRVLDGNESVDEYSYDENGNVIYTKDSGSDDSKCTYVNVRVTPEQQENLIRRNHIYKLVETLIKFFMDIFSKTYYNKNEYYL